MGNWIDIVIILLGCIEHSNNILIIELPFIDWICLKWLMHYNVIYSIYITKSNTFYAVKPRCYIISLQYILYTIISTHQLAKQNLWILFNEFAVNDLMVCSHIWVSHCSSLTKWDNFFHSQLPDQVFKNGSP